MQLGKTIIGAVIGAAIGIAIMVAVYFALGFDKAWMALPVAILTGLGVRMMVATSGHASYLRGALTGALALGAYLLGSNVVAQIAQQNAAKAGQSTRIEKKADADDRADDADKDAMDEAATDAPEAPPVDVRPTPAATTMKKPAAPGSLPTLDFIVLCVSALIAYELGRGTAPKTTSVSTDETPDAPPPDVPQGTHPDA